ncbi:hypothetical protein MBM_07257 [Drepanopeziza brunnea f. sp. 'multigermtubi' MB_m1]|uniref:C2H2-type domain-containing protein n=1 Tax=Marssonina brunnea f. sp. multigermtubi (strain MB_m1) TaxID=1072389 RepID=K1WNL3_MARBU|nr:uncharacterized protein MBM_07257 [Drepanopeziza brunnea f. sp. 'multigermtubi' MB_m1]EKD14536.1 hypothetical protein MBM_07257 [Drepanopeziza brunnea f. sp. 'multigermtubi' MB_m1]
MYLRHSSSLQPSAFSLQPSAFSLQPSTFNIDLSSLLGTYRRISSNMKQVWEDEHDIAFLAFLDFALERGLDYKSIRTRVIPVIEKLTGTTFNEKQISRRTSTILGRDKSDRSNTIKSDGLKKTGSSSLHGLSDEMRGKIRALVEDFRKQEIQGRSDSEHTNTATPRDNSKNFAQTGLENQQVHLEGPSQRSDQGPLESDLRPPKIVQATTSRPSTPPIETPLAGRRNSTVDSGLVEKHTSSETDVLSLADVRRMHKEVVARLKAEVTAVRAQWQREVDNYIQEAKRRRRIESELEAENTHLKTAREERQKAGRGPLEEALFNKDQEIWLLKQSNHKMRTLAGFARRTEPKRKSLEQNEVKDAINAMETELQSILHGHDSSTTLLHPEFGIETDMANLLRVMFQEDTDNIDSPGQLLKKLLECGPLKVVRSFAVAALYEWVFATDFPSFSSDESHPFLKEYRDAVLIHDGWTCLRNLELVAYNSLIDSNEFRKATLPRRSDELASRLSKALAPLFPRSTDVESNARFETWGQEQDICEDRRFRFTGLFDAALQLKARTVATDERYEFVVHPPGTLITEPRTHDAPDLHSKDNTCSWLQASLYTYVGDPSDPPDLLADALIQSNNFISNIKNKQARKQFLAETKLVISESGDAGTDVIEDSRENSLDVELMNQWAYAHGAISSPNDGTAQKRPDEELDQSPASKRVKTIHRADEEYEAEESDDTEEAIYSPPRPKLTKAGAKKASKSCPKCNRSFASAGNATQHMQKTLKSHEQKAHPDDPKRSGSIGSDNNPGDNAHNGAKDTDAGTPSVEKPSRSLATTTDDTESESYETDIADPKAVTCEYCGSTFQCEGDYRHHLDQVSCKEHQDAESDLAKKIPQRKNPVSNAAQNPEIASVEENMVPQISAQTKQGNRSEARSNGRYLASTRIDHVFRTQQKNLVIRDLGREKPRRS